MTTDKEAERLFALGEKALESGDYDAALKNLSMSLSYKRKPLAYLLKAKVQTKKNDIEMAIREAELGVAACTSSDDQIKSELTKFLETCHSLAADKEQEVKQFRKEIAEHKEGAIKGTIAKAFAQEHKCPSLRLRPVFKNGSSSQIKGNPLLPKHFRWPARADGTELTFLAQIDLEEIARFKDIEDLLPQKGILSFFYDTEDQPWGSSSADKDGWKVFYFPKKTELEQYFDHNEEEGTKYSIDWIEEPTYPDLASDEFSSLPEQAHSEYEKFIENCYEEPPFHQLLGHPHLVQADFRESIELVTSGIDYEQIRGIDEKEQKLFNDSRRWKLLLQLDSDETLDFMWGDGGMLYFCIDEQALQKQDFSNVWLELQCY
ncbi:MAG: YwqG family protein [Candidatus Obscuribacterales bacterium]